MSFSTNFKQNLTKINSDSFDENALALFDYQWNTCEIYKQFCSLVKKSPKNTKTVSQIPALPIEFFKSQNIKSNSWTSQKVFKSSGTTSENRSMHHCRDLTFYHELTKLTFESQLDLSLRSTKILALLPSYHEQGDSSLISMVDYLMSHAHPNSRYLSQIDESAAKEIDENTIIFGVSFALLDQPKIAKKGKYVIETGGMKGRKKEITRIELHSLLSKSFANTTIYSEYGMTELTSQAYGKNGFFEFPPWAKAYIREMDDPFCKVKDHRSGGINIFDLANVDTCAFIETKDIGSLTKNGFTVLGRFDNSDIRGCNLMF